MSPRTRPLAGPDVYLWAAAFLLGAQLAMIVRAGHAAADERRRHRGMLRDAAGVLEAEAARTPERVFIAPPADPEPPA